jgi:hypothetical protein
MSVGMPVSKDWTEHHLTPRGWKSGSKRTDIACIKELYPLDRIATERFIEERLSADDKIARRTELLWESKDKQLVTKLRAKFGPSPESL